MHLTNSQLHCAAEMSLIMRSVWAKARRLSSVPCSFYSEPIPLTKYYRIYNRQCRPIILMVIDIYFERISRGNNLEGRATASLWIPRPPANIWHPRKDIMKTLYDENQDRIVTITEFIREKDAKTFEKVTEFSFPSVEMREAFGQYLNTATKPGDGAAPKRRSTKKVAA